MKHPQQVGNREGALLVTGLLLAGGLGLGFVGGRQWFTFQRVAAIPLPPDGSMAQLPPLPELRRLDVQVVLEGATRGRYNGVSYDALEAISADGARRPHGCLELEPALLRPMSGSRPFHRTFAPVAGQEFTGMVITARWTPDRVLEDMQLPIAAQKDAFQGVLMLELWTRDRFRQGSVAVVLVLLGGLLGGLGATRARRHFQLARNAAARPSEPDLLLERVRERQEEVARVLRNTSDNGNFPQERLYTIGEISEELARTAAECGQLPGTEAAATYKVCVTRLRETEAALGRIAARIQTQETLRPDLLPELFTTLDRELTVLAQTERGALRPGG